jgi:hypothetical protein
MAEVCLLWLVWVIPSGWANHRHPDRKIQVNHMTCFLHISLLLLPWVLHYPQPHLWILFLAILHLHDMALPLFSTDVAGSETLLGHLHFSFGFDGESTSLLVYYSPSVLLQSSWSWGEGYFISQKVHWIGEHSCPRGSVIDWYIFASNELAFALPYYLVESTTTQVDSKSIMSGKVLG